MSGFLLTASQPDDMAPLLVCVHGGGCNGRYFDLKGFSTAQAALARGQSALLVNRPGHGGSETPRSQAPITEAARLLAPFTAEIRSRYGLEDRAVVMIGHSIGGAVVLESAALQTDLPLKAIAVSGIGDRPTAEAQRWFGTVLAGNAAPEPPASFFFGPEGTYDWRGPAALRRCGEAWQPAEVLEVMGVWPERFAEIAAGVPVPVFIRLAEHEGIWDNRQATLQRMAAALARAPEVSVELLPDGGHLYEIHKMGHRLIADELDFLDRWSR